MRPAEPFLVCGCNLYACAVSLLYYYLCCVSVCLLHCLVLCNLKSSCLIAFGIINLLTNRKSYVTY